MDHPHGPLESIDDDEVDSADDLELAELDTAQTPPPWNFWRALLASIGAHAGLIWVLDAIPVRTGEALALRWLRALAEHPIRGPLGLALGYVAVIQLVRAVFNRASRT